MIYYFKGDKIKGIDLTGKLECIACEDVIKYCLINLI